MFGREGSHDDVHKETNMLNLPASLTHNITRFAFDSGLDGVAVEVAGGRCFVFCATKSDEVMIRLRF